MSFWHLLELLKTSPGIAYGIGGITVAVVVITRLSRSPNLDAIPTVGSTTWLGSWWDDFKHFANAVDVIQEGYDTHKSAPFKISYLFRWTVIVSSREHIEELVRAPNDVLSLTEGVNDELNTRYTLGDAVHDKPFHSGVIRIKFARNMGTLYPEIRDEIATAFNDVLELEGNEWKSVPASSLIQTIVCRASNRLFVGLPLCRDPDWIDLNNQYTIEIAKAGAFLRLFPKFMRPLAVCFFTGIAQGARRGLRHLGPLIEERLQYGGEKDELPNDLLSWLMAEAEGSSLTPQSLTTRVLFINITAIHTSSNSFTHALFYLAANPQYIQPLREEVETFVEKEGWSKATLSKMRKVDSFLKECQRLEGISAMSIIRKAMKDFTFSDGTFIPKGTLIGVANRAIQYEDKFYENANIFKPFRFVAMHGEGEESVQGQYASTAMDYLVFGHGKHACPGRFFAASTLKSILAHIVVTYDVKLEDDATRPHSFHFGTSIIANPRARVLFRKRAK